MWFGKKNRQKHYNRSHEHWCRGKKDVTSHHLWICSKCLKNWIKTSDYNPSMFSEGYAVYAFRLVPSDLGEEYIKLVRQESVRLDVKFAMNKNRNIELFGVWRISGIDQNWPIKRYQVHCTPEYECAKITIANYITRNSRYTPDAIRGIFSLNNPPDLVSKFPSAYICNTDPSFLPGSNWVGFRMQSPIQPEF